MIATYGCCGCAGPTEYGIPGGYFSQLPPEGVAYETPHASMVSPVEPLVPMQSPPSIVPIPDNTMPDVVPGYLPPPNSVITETNPPPSIVSKPDTVQSLVNVMPAGGSPVPIQGNANYAGWYGKPSAQAKCDKFKAELAKAQRGEGSGIFGWFDGQGIFGNRENALQNKIEKWCGKAMTEAEAMKAADDLYKQAIATGDVAMEAALDEALAAQQAADRQTQLYAAAGIGIAALGLVGLIMFTDKKRGR